MSPANTLRLADHELGSGSRFAWYRSVASSEPRWAEGTSPVELPGGLVERHYRRSGLYSGWHNRSARPPSGPRTPRSPWGYTSTFASCRASSFIDWSIWRTVSREMLSANSELHHLVGQRWSGDAVCPARCAARKGDQHPAGPSSLRSRNPGHGRSLMAASSPSSTYRSPRSGTVATG